MKTIPITFHPASKPLMVLLHDHVNQCADGCQDFTKPYCSIGQRILLGEIDDQNEADLKEMQKAGC